MSKNKAKPTLDQAREIIRQAAMASGIRLSWITPDEVTRLALEYLIDQEAKGWPNNGWPHD